MDLNEEAVQQYIGRRGRERMVVRLTTTYANQCLSLALEIIGYIDQCKMSRDVFVSYHW
jgi:hypothetical protein